MLLYHVGLGIYLTDSDNLILSTNFKVYSWNLYKLFSILKNGVVLKRLKTIKNGKRLENKPLNIYKSQTWFTQASMFKMIRIKMKQIWSKYWHANCVIIVCSASSKLSQQCK